MRETWNSARHTILTVFAIPCVVYCLIWGAHIKNLEIMAHKITTSGNVFRNESDNEITAHRTNQKQPAEAGCLYAIPVTAESPA